jgi:hypothetical protein
VKKSEAFAFLRLALNISPELVRLSLASWAPDEKENTLGLKHNNFGASKQSGTLACRHFAKAAGN